MPVNSFHFSSLQLFFFSSNLRNSNGCSLFFHAIHFSSAEYFSYFLFLFKLLLYIIYLNALLSHPFRTLYYTILYVLNFLQQVAFNLANLVRDCETFSSVFILYPFNFASGTSFQFFFFYFLLAFSITHNTD